MEPLLVVESLRKTYRGHWLIDSTIAVRDISLAVRPGELLGLLGPNGSGKTTTFKAATGLVRPSGGRIRLFGRPPWQRAARTGLGFLPEQPYFHDFLTGEEFVDLAARLAGVPAAARRQAVTNALDRVGLGDARRRRIRTYSKGMSQRVGIAQAIVAKPALVILDEPMTGLDPIGRREVRDLIAALARDGAGVVFSSHVLQDAELICDRVVIIDAGRVLLEGALGELLAGHEDGPVEVTARGLDAEVARSLVGPGVVLLPAVAERVAFRAADDDAASRLRAAIEARGARVVAYASQPRRLEDVFLTEIARGRASDPGRRSAS